MKTTLYPLLGLLLLPVLIFGQIPSGYYNGTSGLTGYALKTKLHQIISNGHEDQGYGALYDGYVTTDSDNYYEMDGTVLDMYSENPIGSDPYNFTHGYNTCGTYNSEGDCYNREHIIPQSIFDSAYPMKSDIHFVVPTDGYVNNRRSSYPFGEVSYASWTSDNGSKVGSNTYGSYTGTVFEPIDEFKGDIARMLFYFATRYEDQVNNWEFDMFDGSQNKVFTNWALDMLIQWHIQDPVSQREIDRNNAAYDFQGNANPFIDHPEWVYAIWSPDAGTQDANIPKVSISPNPASTNVSIRLSEKPERIQVFDILGNEIFSVFSPKKTSYINVSQWNNGTYLIKIVNKSTTLTRKLIVRH